MMFVRILLRAVLLATLALVGGCFFTGAKHSQGVLIGTARAPSQGAVRLVMHGDELSEPYEEIAIVQAKSSFNVDGRPAILAALESEARAVGANGVIEVRVNDNYADPNDPEQGWFLASGVAVYFETSTSESAAEGE